ncbi:MAG: hypothetical protein IPL20_03205 [Saprospiraceae bacterium]|nr:hypothetical protein [Saprospiraceae bacterium]
MVKKFVKAIKQGWEKALIEPEKAIRYLKKYDVNIDETRELLSLKKDCRTLKGKMSKSFLHQKIDGIIWLWS